MVVIDRGYIVDLSQTNYIWLIKYIIFENDKNFFSDIVPNSKMPLSSCVLKDLLPKLKVYTKHNFIVLAGAVMSFHYKKIIAIWMVVASGPFATWKTTAIKVGLSLFGCCNNNMFVKSTNQGSSISTLPYGIDDPRAGGKTSGFVELAVDLYNGSPTTNYSISIPILATNFESEMKERWVINKNNLEITIICTVHNL